MRVTIPIAWKSDFDGSGVAIAPVLPTCGWPRLRYPWKATASSPGTMCQSVWSNGPSAQNVRWDFWNRIYRYFQCVAGVIIFPMKIAPFFNSRTPSCQRTELGKAIIKKQIQNIFGLQQIERNAFQHEHATTAHIGRNHPFPSHHSLSFAQHVQLQSSLITKWRLLTAWPTVCSKAAQREWPKLFSSKAGELFPIFGFPITYRTSNARMIRMPNL